MDGSITGNFNLTGSLDTGGGSSVEVTPILDDGTKIATITVDNVGTDLYAPTPDTVIVSQVQQSGTKIASITTGGHTVDLYTPSIPSVGYVNELLTGNKMLIGGLLVGENVTPVYSPYVSYTDSVGASGTQIGTLSFGSQNYVVKAPTPSSGIDYSVTEQDTGLLWVDGRHIYQITVILSEMTSTAQNVIIGNTTDLNIDNVISMDGTACYRDNNNITTTVKLPYYNTNSYYLRAYVLTNGASYGTSYDGKTILILESSNDSFNYYRYNVFMTIRYVKVVS